MKFHLPKSFAKSSGEHIFFVEEAAAAWAECLMTAAESIVTTTPVKTKGSALTPTKAAPGCDPASTQLSIDLSGASLPDSTVEFLCNTVLPHFFEVAFSAGTTSATAVLPALRVRLQCCSLSPQAAVSVVEALVTCTEVFSNTFAALLHSGKKKKVLSVNLDLGFNKELDDLVASALAEALHTTADEPASSQSAAVTLELDLGLSGTSVGNRGLLDLLQASSSSLASLCSANPAPGQFIGLNMAQTEVTFMTVDSTPRSQSDEIGPHTFCDLVCDSLLDHPTLTCLTLGDDAFDIDEEEEGVEGTQDDRHFVLMQNLQLAGRSNLTHSCAVVVCNEDGLLVATACQTTASSVKTFAPCQIIPVKPVADAASQEEYLKQENAALRAQLEDLKSISKKKKKKTVKKAKRVDAQPVVVGPLGVSPAVAGLHPTDKENSSSSTGAGKKSSSSMNMKQLPRPASGRISRSNSVLSSSSCLSNITSSTSSGGCTDCVKLRRALHTHGANPMPTATLRPRKFGDVLEKSSPWQR